jgi:hypothetical protein
MPKLYSAQGSEAGDSASDYWNGSTASHADTLDWMNMQPTQPDDWQNFLSHGRNNKSDDDWRAGMSATSSGTGDLNVSHTTQDWRPVAPSNASDHNSSQMSTQDGEAKDAVYLVSFSRYPVELRDALQTGPMAAAARASAKEPSYKGARFYCHPDQVDAVHGCIALSTEDVRPYHVFMTQSCRGLLMSTIQNCPSRKGVRVKNEVLIGHVDLPDSHFDEGADIVDRCLDFLTPGLSQETKSPVNTSQSPIERTSSGPVERSSKGSKGGKGGTASKGKKGAKGKGDDGGVSPGVSLEGTLPSPFMMPAPGPFSAQELPAVAGRTIADPSELVHVVKDVLQAASRRKEEGVTADDFADKLLSMVTAYRNRKKSTARLKQLGEELDLLFAATDGAPSTEGASPSFPRTGEPFAEIPPQVVGLELREGSYEQEAVHILTFSRYPMELCNALLSEPLAPFRFEAREGDAAPGPKIFCAGDQFPSVLECIARTDYTAKPYHVLVSEGCRETVNNQIKRCSGHKGVRVKEEVLLGYVPVSMLSRETFRLDQSPASIWDPLPRDPDATWQATVLRGFPSPDTSPVHKPREHTLEDQQALIAATLTNLISPLTTAGTPAPEEESVADRVIHQIDRIVNHYHERRNVRA